MLQMQPSKNGPSGFVGKVEIKGDIIDLNYDDINTPAEIEHTSIHASGESHTKLKDGTRSINYGKDNPGIPLRGLKSVKHLGTIISREMTDDDIVNAERTTDVPIERNLGQKFSVLDVLAIPKSINVNFNFEWDMENEREVQLNVGMHRLGFKGFDVIIFTRSSNQFDTIPSKSLHLPDMNNIVPFVTKIDKEKVSIKLSKLTFDEIIRSQETNDPNEGFTVLSATNKYL